MREKNSFLIKKILTAVIALVVAFSAIGCSVDVGYGLYDDGNKTPSVKRLDTPTELTVSGFGNLSWKRVSLAAGYVISINGTSYTIMTNSFSLYDANNAQLGYSRPKNGVFSISIHAYPIAGSGYSDSLKATMSHNAAGQTLSTPSIESAAGNIIKWRAVDNASSYKVVVNDADLSSSAEGTQINLSGVSGDVFNISISAMGDKVYYLDSGVSQLLYERGATKPKLDVPTNLRMDGLTLKFDRVSNAYGYQTEDVLTNRHIFTETERDLSEFTMPRVIRAVSSDPAESGAFLPSDFVSVDTIIFKNGSGTQADPYLISSAAEFRYIELFERQGIAKHYKLTANLDFTPAIAIGAEEEGSSYMEIGSLCGVIDGDGFAITNITAHRTKGWISMFDTITATGEIKNLVFKNNDFKTWRVQSGDKIEHPSAGSIAAIANVNYGKINSVVIEDNDLIAEDDDTAGLVTFNYGTIKDCIVRNNSFVAVNEVAAIAVYNAASGIVDGCELVSAVEFEGFKNAAGLVSLNHGTIKNSTNSADLTAGSEEFGGIASWNQGTITECVNNGNINGATFNFIGGIVGKTSGNVAKSVNNGIVSGADCVGGIAGGGVGDAVQKGQESTLRLYYNTNNGSVSGARNIGGILGYSDFASVQYSSNNGTITAGLENAGGIAGLIIPDWNKYSSNPSDNRGQSYVRYCFNTASVTSAAQAGGIVGQILAGRVVNCYNLGDVSGLAANTGGIVGVAYDYDGGRSNIGQCYNAGTVSSNFAIVGSETSSAGHAYVYRNRGVQAEQGGTGYPANQYAQVSASNMKLSAFVATMNGLVEDEDIVSGVSNVFVANAGGFPKLWWE